MTEFSPIASLIAEKLIAAEQTISVAESSTGGLIAANLLSVPGASAYFIGGSVVYTIKSRRAFLDFDRERIKKLKPLTEEMAFEFARSAREKLESTWGLAELGAAGPAGTPYGGGAGISVIGLCGPVEATVKVETQSNDRANNMNSFAEAALQLLLENL